MKKIVLILIITCTTITGFSQQQFQLLSPDKTIKISIETGKQLIYSVFIDDKQITKESEIDMQLTNNIALSNSLKIKSTKTKSINENIVAQVPISRKNIPDVYN